MYLGEKDFHYNVKGSFTMRKLISLGLLALSLSFLSNAAFAGEVAECEKIKDGYTPGLYGLCIAYANAGNDNARRRISDNYVARAQASDLTLDEIFTPVGAGDPLECPCWTPLSLGDMTASLFLIGCNDLADVVEALFFDESIGDFAEFNAGYSIYAQTVPDDSECVTKIGGSQETYTTTPEQDALCRSDLRTLCEIL
jgi:hypothetical protein